MSDELDKILDNYRDGSFYPRPFEPDRNKWSEKHQEEIKKGREAAKKALLKWRTDSLKEIVPESFVFGHQLQETGVFRIDPQVRYHNQARRYYQEGFNACREQILNNLTELKQL